MRIIAGKFRSTPLFAPSGGGTRPTADRVRENLFNILGTWQQKGELPPWPEISVLDAFCGTGSLGLEALSRGAAQAVFMDSDSGAAETCRKNISACLKHDSLASSSAVFLQADATAPPAPLADFRAGLVFLDPPYGEGLGLPALAALRVRNWLKPEHLCVLETDKKHPEATESLSHYKCVDTRLYGRVRLQFLKHIPDGINAGGNAGSAEDNSR